MLTIPHHLLSIPVFVGSLCSFLYLFVLFSVCSSIAIFSLSRAGYVFCLCSRIVLSRRFVDLSISCIFILEISILTRNKAYGYVSPMLFMFKCAISWQHTECITL